MHKYNVIDLFAGAGGLSLGFIQTQKYTIKAAFENNKNMQYTYHKNHPETEIYGDVSTADYTAIAEKFGEIDIVIGGPPCQGFSNANRQKNHAINKNNTLVKQYIRAIQELQPKAFVMENVSMLRSEVHKFYMEENEKKQIKQYNLTAEPTELILLEEKYSFEDAKEIVKSPEKIKEILWPEDQYTEFNIIYKNRNNPQKLEKILKKHKSSLLKYSNKYLNSSDNSYVSEKNRQAFSAIINYFESTANIHDVINAVEPAIMIQRMANKAKEIFDNNIEVEEFALQKNLIAKVYCIPVYDYLKAVLGAEKYGYNIVSGVLCAADFGAPQKRMRFIAIGIKKDICPQAELPTGTYKENKYNTVYDAIADLAEIEPVTDIAADYGIVLNNIKLNKLNSTLRDTTKLYNHIITKSTQTALERFTALKQGENFHSLDESLKNNTYTNTARTQNTIYLRLKYDQPCGTVVNVRKSMWIHPEKNRAISIREAARLQTFPDSFIFCGTKDQQYQQVGNAVPPMMAKAIAEKLAELLKSK